MSKIETSIEIIDNMTAPIMTMLNSINFLVKGLESIESWSGLNLSVKADGILAVQENLQSLDSFFDNIQNHIVNMATMAPENVADQSIVKSVTAQENFNKILAESSSLLDIVKAKISNVFNQPLAEERILPKGLQGTENIPIFRNLQISETSITNLLDTLHEKLNTGIIQVLENVKTQEIQLPALTFMENNAIVSEKFNNSLAPLIAGFNVLNDAVSLFSTSLAETATGGFQAMATNGSAVFNLLSTNVGGFLNFLETGFNSAVGAVETDFYNMSVKVTGYIKNIIKAMDTLEAKIPSMKINVTAGLDSFYNKVEKVSNDLKVKTAVSNTGLQNASAVAYGTATTADIMNGKNYVSVTGDQLKHLRGMADTETVNKFTTASIKIEQTNNNHINKNMDTDTIIHSLTDGVYKAMEVVAEGTYV